MAPPRRRSLRPCDQPQTDMNILTPRPQGPQSVNRWFYEGGGTRKVCPFIQYARGSRKKGWGSVKRGHFLKGYFLQKYWSKQGGQMIIWERVFSVFRKHQFCEWYDRSPVKRNATNNTATKWKLNKTSHSSTRKGIVSFFLNYIDVPSWQWSWSTVMAMGYIWSQRRAPGENCVKLFTMSM